MYHDVYKRFAREFDVYDGDSFKADLDEGDYRWELARPFRLYGIDTPEMYPKWEYYTREDGSLDEENRALEQTAADKAKKRVQEYLEASEGPIVIQTIKRPGKPVRDKYGRSLCRVYVYIDGVEICVNERLLLEKHAIPYNGGTKAGAWAHIRDVRELDPHPKKVAEILKGS